MKRKNPRTAYKQADLFAEGKTARYVPLEDADPDELRKLPLANFSDDELVALDEALLLEIVQNDVDRGLRRDEIDDDRWENCLTEEAQAIILGADEPDEDRIDALTDLVNERWKQTTEPDDVLEYHKDSFYDDLGFYLGESDDLINSVGDKFDSEGTIEAYEADGYSNEQIVEAINEALGDSDNWDLEESEEYYRYGVFKLSASSGQLWVDSEELAPVLEKMTDGEIEEALKRINRNCGLDLKRKDLRNGIEVDLDIQFYADANPDIEKVEEAIKNLLENEDPAGPDKTPPALDEARVVYRFKDGAYVYDLTPDDLPQESRGMGHCVGKKGSGYGAAVQRGEIKILSLRTSSGRPKFTFEARLGEAQAGGVARYSHETGHRRRSREAANDWGIVHFDQIKGKANRYPGFDLKRESGTPAKDVKWDEVDKIVEFVKAMGLKPEEQEDLRYALGLRAGRPLKQNPTPFLCPTHGPECGLGFCRPYRRR